MIYIWFIYYLFIIIPWFVYLLRYFISLISLYHSIRSTFSFQTTCSRLAKTLFLANSSFIDSDLTIHDKISVE